MRRAAFLTILSVCAALPILATGCTPQDRYDSLLTANRSLQEQLVVIEDERDEARTSLRTVQGQLAQSRSSYGTLQSRYDDLNGVINGMEQENDDLLRRIASQQIGPLPEDIEIALTQLAAQYPALLTFDAKLGMLRFASDLTFNSGKATVRTEAEETVSALAAILASPAAQPLEARIVGHTDDVPIKYSAAKHPTNMHLAVHRAIAVRDTLVASGVDPIRLQAAGYGEFRPIVPNHDDGTAQNRRVEIFLVPMPELDFRVTSAPTAPPVAATVEPEPVEVEPMK